MTITFHTDIIQYTPEWTAVKCGVLSASKMDKIITAKKLEPSKSEATQDFADELACQRVIREIDPTFQNYEMRRGLREEVLARDKYSAAYAPVTECGFITNDKWGFSIGCSPDGLIGQPNAWEGGMEAKSKLRKLQFQVVRSAKLPDDHRLQVQTSLMVSELPWWDFVSYAGAMNMIVIRVEPNPAIIKPIEDAAFKFEEMVRKSVEEYGNRLADGNLRILVTPPTPDEDDIISSSDEQEAL